MPLLFLLTAVIRINLKELMFYLRTLTIFYITKMDTRIPHEGSDNLSIIPSYQAPTLPTNATTLYQKSARCMLVSG
jgi:hypothetical protein